MKKFLAIVAMVSILVPGVLQAATLNPEDIAPKDAMVTADFSLTGKLKALLSPFINAELKNLSSSAEDEKVKLLVNKFLAGEKVFVSFTMPESILVSLPITDAEFETLITGTTKTTYESTDIYSDEDSYLARLGGMVVISGGSDVAIKEAIDYSTGKLTNPLSSNESYKKMTADYLSPRAFGFTLNIGELAKLMETTLPASDNEKDKAIVAVVEILKLLDFEGGSFGEVAEGYKFNFKVAGNAENLAKEGMTMNEGGTFTPNMFKKFPNAKPLFYSESFNPKANFAQTKKMMNKMQVLSLSTTNVDLNIFEQLKKELGVDLEEIYNVFDKEVAFGLQYDQNSPLPYLTIMGNVASNKSGGVKIVSDLVAMLKKALKENDVSKKLLNVTTEGGFTKFTIDLTKAPDYEGPAFPKIVFTAGVTDDGLLILSNFPDIDHASARTGFTADFDNNKDISGFMNFNMRNAWGYMDMMVQWAEKLDEKHAPSLDFYNGYYTLLEKIYGFRELTVVSTSTASSVLATGTIAIDQAKHKTYKQFVDELNTSDRDGDGSSDFDEYYIYRTPVDSGDANKDGVSDLETLNLGKNPNDGEKLFKDMGEKEYYTRDVAMLYQRGAIQGYDDKTFKPGNMVNRAEFTTMVVKAFEEGTANFLGVNISLPQAKPVFDDVSADAWYYPYVSKAYGAGFISGSFDLKTGKSMFRPGDSITRAEAMAILNKASKSLSKTQTTGVSECAKNKSAFSDVSSEDWFCGAVSNGAANGITKGKTPGSFKPFDNLNRAEAAVMIQRTLEKDFTMLQKETGSVGDMFKPLGKQLAPLL